MDIYFIEENIQSIYGYIFICICNKMDGTSKQIFKKKYFFFCKYKQLKDIANLIKTMRVWSRKTIVDCRPTGYNFSKI